MGCTPDHPHPYPRTTVRSLQCKQGCRSCRTACGSVAVDPSASHKLCGKIVLYAVVIRTTPRTLVRHGRTNDHAVQHWRRTAFIQTLLLHCFQMPAPQAARAITAGKDAPARFGLSLRRPGTVNQAAWGSVTASLNSSTFEPLTSLPDPDGTPAKSYLLVSIRCEYCRLERERESLRD